MSMAHVVRGVHDVVRTIAMGKTGEARPKLGNDRFPPSSPVAFGPWQTAASVGSVTQQ